MFLPANGSEKSTTDYCNHNNIFRSSETENEMPDKHMLFFNKDLFSAKWTKPFPRLLCKAEHGCGGCSSTLGMPHCDPPITNCSITLAFSLLCILSHDAKQGWYFSLSSPHKSFSSPKAQHEAISNPILKVLSGLLRTKVIWSELRFVLGSH